MRHIKFRVNWSNVLEKNIFEGFLTYMGMAAFLVVLPA